MLRSQRKRKLNGCAGPSRERVREETQKKREREHRASVASEEVGGRESEQARVMWGSCVINRLTNSFLKLQHFQMRNVMV